VSDLSPVLNVIIVYFQPPFFDGLGAEWLYTVVFDLGKYLLEIHQACNQIAPPIHEEADLLNQDIQILIRAF
jgi:hypothetical protein